MAIDSMLFAVSVASGTATSKGQIIPLKQIRGPTVVRDGYGKAILKQVFTSASGSSANVVGHITVKNQNWIDEMSNMVAGLSATSLGKNSACVQRGGDIELSVNSAFSVNLIVDEDLTTTAVSDYYVLIDIDYPEVEAVSNPKDETGTPVTINLVETVTTTAIGNAENTIWTTYNVDIFKAGFKYLLAEVGMRVSGGAGLCFFSVSNAAGQQGLERIVPINVATQSALRFDIEYSTPLVKGPMQINLAAVFSASAAQTCLVEMDYIRR